MKSSGKVWLLVALALVGGLFAGLHLNRPAFGDAQEGKGVVSQRYNIVLTEGTNLIVTDNQANVVYYYTIEEEGKPGDDLILRGSVDLSQVGKKVMKPTLINPRKKPEKD